MHYELETLCATLLAQRQAKDLSQRDLSALSSLPQAQISRIEAGHVDVRLSSLIALVQALDLEIVLVPRQLGPTVAAVIRGDALDPAQPRYTTTAPPSLPEDSYGDTTS